MGEFKKIVAVRGRRFLLSVEESAAASDYLKYEALRNDIWGFPEDSFPGTRNMMCENFLHDGSSLFIGLYAEDATGRLSEDAARLVGFSYGFVGLKDPGLGFKSLENLRFYSQYTGVRPEFHGFGLGISLKEFQRDVLLETFGIGVVTCTFDPLTAVNAYRNIRRFGMDVLEYRPATYGDFGGFLNRSDVPSDRFFVSWDLRKIPRAPSEVPEAYFAGRPDVVETESARVSGRSGLVALERAAALHLDADSDFLRVPIPRDFYLMLRETDVDDPGVRRIPLDWRMKTREAFRSLFDRGYRIIDFRSSADEPGRPHYVLENERHS